MNDKLIWNITSIKRKNRSDAHLERTDFSPTAVFKAPRSCIARQGWRDVARRRLPPSFLSSRDARDVFAGSFARHAAHCEADDTILKAGDGVLGLSPIMFAKSARSVTLGCVSMLISGWCDK